MTQTPMLARRGIEALALCALLALGAACSNDFTPQGIFPTSNLEPTTEIVNPVLRGEETTYNLLVSWRGSDEDGTIAGFEIAVDDTSEWFFTSRYESSFVFGAQTCCRPDTTVFPDSSIRIDSLFTDFHTLFVRAVDNNGAIDSSPDNISFNSTTITPETVILRGPSPSGAVQITATTVIIEWEGRDPDGVVVGYFYKLDDNPWVAVGADCTLVRFRNLTTAQFYGDPAGFHDFTVYAIDNAGAREQTIDLGENYRRWESVQNISGILRISSNVLGTRFGVNNQEGQVFEGTRLSFDWRGDASLYGGLIQCYSHAYDDLVNFTPCDIGDTHFPPGVALFSPPIGSHQLYVRAFDDAGQTIEANFKFVVLEGPGGIDPADRNVLYIDDFDDGTGTSGDYYPGDPAEEAFWDSVLTGFALTKFDAEDQLDIPEARFIGTKSTLVWYIDGESELATANIPSNFRNPIGPYINAGGNLILCGSIPTDALTPDNTFDPRTIENPGCPHQPRETYGGGEFGINWFPAFCDTGLHFVYDFFKISRSFYPPNDRLGRLVSTGLALPNGEPLPDIPIDFGKRGRVPGIDIPILSGGLDEVEQFDLRQFGVGDVDTVIALWRFEDISGALKRPCAVYIPKSETTGRGHIAILGFAPFYFETTEMQKVFRTLLTLMGEDYQGSD